MGRYSSDSDEDRRKKHRSSRKRDRRSRSRERRRRSRSRDRRRSRSSSYEDYRRSRSSKKDHRYSRSSSSRSYSSDSSDNEKRRSRKDKKGSTSSSQVSKEKEQTRKKMNKALAKAESKDEVLKRDKAAKELRQLAPDKEAILRIESDEFVPQSFSSSAGSKTQQIDEKNKDGSHEVAMFGAGGSVPEASSVAVVSEVKAGPQAITSQTKDKEGLFASWLHEDEETKTARWITKLKKMRQELLAAT